AWRPLHFAAWYPLHAIPRVASERSSAAAISSQRSRVVVVSATSPSSCGAWTWTCSGMDGDTTESGRYAQRVSGACCIPGDEHHGDRSTTSLESVPAGGGRHPGTLVEIAAG